MNLKDALAIVYDLAIENALNEDDQENELLEEAKEQGEALAVVLKHLEELRGYSF